MAGAGDDAAAIAGAGVHLVSVTGRTDLGEGSNGWSTQEDLHPAGWEERPSAMDVRAVLKAARILVEASEQGVSSGARPHAPPLSPPRRHHGNKGKGSQQGPAPTVRNLLKFENYDKPQTTAMQNWLEPPERAVVSQGDLGRARCGECEARPRYARAWAWTRAWTWARA